MEPARGAALLPACDDAPPPQRIGARLCGLAVLGAAAYAAGAALARATVPGATPALPSSAAAAARRLHASAGLLGVSVLADSALEHWRGSFENPGMVAPLLSAAMTIAAGASGASAGVKAQYGARDRAYASAVATGIAGTGFHVYNLLRRPGGWCWMNLFYAAPLGAPAALSLSGLLGLAAQRLGSMPGLRAGRLLAALTSIGIAGSAAEAGLLHFRGAFQNPFMWLPVSVPPLACASLACAAIGPRRRNHRLTRALLQLTALFGVAGVGFHAYGVSRQMGGWRNARQNLLSGPPLPAPPAFSALALAGGAALSLLEA
jgi:hypothetical protein